MITFTFLGMIAAVTGLTKSYTDISLGCSIIFMICQVGAMLLYARLKERVKTLEDKMKGGMEE